MTDGSLRLAPQAIADTGLGDHIGGVRRIRLELRPDVGEVDAQIVGLVLVARSPDLLEELTVGDEPPGMLRQLTEQVEFDRCQVDLRLAPPDRAIRQIDLEVAHPDPGVAILAAAAQDSPHAGEQLLGPEGLGDVVVCPGVERAHLLMLIADRRQHDDRHLAPAADLRGNVRPVAVGKDQIEDDRVGWPNRDGVERLPLGGGLLDAIPGVREDHPKPTNYLRLVVHDENARLTRGHPTVTGCSTSGNETANAVPSGESACRRISPPFASTNPLEIASPRPAPSLFSPVWNGLKIALRWATGTPGPRSTTRIVTLPAPTPPLIRTG